MNKLLHSIIFFVLVIFILYCAVATTVFQYRNPKANDMCIFREFGDVIKFNKLEKYQ